MSEPFINQAERMAWIDRALKMGETPAGMSPEEIAGALFAEAARQLRREEVRTIAAVALCREVALAAAGAFRGWGSNPHLGAILVALGARLLVLAEMLPEAPKPAVAVEPEVPAPARAEPSPAPNLGLLAEPMADQIIFHFIHRGLLPSARDLRAFGGLLAEAVEKRAQAAEKAGVPEGTPLPVGPAPEAMETTYLRSIIAWPVYGHGHVLTPADLRTLAAAHQVAAAIEPLGPFFRDAATALEEQAKAAEKAADSLEPQPVAPGEGPAR